MFQMIYCGATSACFELDSTKPYFFGETYTVLVNGTEVTQRDTNVFSVFSLKPNTDYTVTVRTASGKEDSKKFTTAKETCCINVRDFGAAGDGVKEDTSAIQAAISLLPEGGRLFFPAGTYLTLPLLLKSHITLEFDAGAVLLGSTDRERYPILPGACTDMVSGEDLPVSSFEGNEVPCYQSLLQAAFAEDITLVGRGALDGNAPNADWWEGFEEFPAMRPRMVFVNRCKNVTIHGLKIGNGPTWHIHPFFSQNVSVLDCSFHALKDSPNTDACNPESCDGVRIIGNYFSVGDDCIAIKSGKLEMARKYGIVSANHHTIRNCMMDFGHGAVTLGSELAGGIRNLTVTQCYFHATDRGLRIKSRRGRGKDSVIENVTFENMKMEGVLTPIVINMWYNCCDPDRYTEYVWSREHLPVDDRTPHMGGFAFRHMECTGVEVAACYIDGLPESPIDRVELEDITVTYAENARPGLAAMMNFAKENCKLGLYLDNVKHISLKNVKVEGADGKGLIVDHCEKLDMKDCEVD